MKTRGGFATIIALVLLALTTAALAATAVLCTSVVRREAIEKSTAQTRQLELAAMIDVTTRAKNWPAIPVAESYTFAVPKELPYHMTIAIKPAGEKAAIVITVKDGPRTELQSMQMHRVDGAWRWAGQ